MSCFYCKSTKNIVENENYCIYHIELKNLTPEEITNGVKCTRCPRLAFKTKTCNVCITKATNRRKTPEDLSCKFNFNNKCPRKKINESDYCVLHDYLKDYTEEMLNNLSVCSGCKKKIFIKDNYKSCEKCRNHKKKNVDESIKTNIEELNIEEPIKTNIEEQIKTNIEEPIKTNIEEPIKTNIELCSNFNRRGCKNIATDGFKRCLKCREKEKEQYDKMKNKIIKIIDNTT
jgi:hypothetical protein